MASVLTELLTSDTTLAYLGTAIAYVAVKVYALFSKSSAEAKAQRIAAVEKALSVGYQFVNEVKRVTGTTVDDKAAVALKAANDYLATLKQPALAPVEAQRALLTFKALHGEGK